MSHIEKLVDGFKRFRSDNFEENRALFDRLSRQGQSPRTIVVGCCDSRVDPAIVTDCDPGDLFIIRNVANLVPPFETSGNYHGTSAALEFGVRNLEVEDIVVLGHAQCGGIRALLNQAPGAESQGGFFPIGCKLPTKRATVCCPGCTESPWKSRHEPASRRPFWCPWTTC